MLSYILKQRRNEITIVMIFLIFLTGCKGKSEQPETIAEAINVKYRTSSELIVGSPVNVSLQNTTSYCIKFPLDTGMKVFAQQNENWVEVPNLVTFIGDATLTLKPDGDIFSERLINIRPDVTGLIINAPVEFYALLTGNLCEDETVQIQKKIPFTLLPGGN